MVRPGRRALLTLIGVLLLAGCSRAPTPAPLPATTSVASTRPTASASPSPTAFTSTCDDSLPVSEVNRAVGAPVLGTTAFVVGIPEPNIGRLANLNCRYGIPDPVPGQPPGAAQVEIGVNLYTSPAVAASRVQATVNSYLSTGATPTPTTVGTNPATILTGSGDPTLVVAAGARTVAVTVAPPLLTSNEVLVKVASLALTAVR